MTMWLELLVPVTTKMDLRSSSHRVQVRTLVA
jgi:hypothetical protein